MSSVITISLFVVFQGVLMRIDSVNSTLTVSNVACFGTEDRAEPAKAIAPSEVIYESITFRANDICELDVIGIVENVDPAIVELGVCVLGSWCIHLLI